jgi:hypothetical protein
MRKFSMLGISLMTAGLVAVAVVSPASAADYSNTARMISIPSPTGPSHSNTAYNGLAATNVSVGPETSGLPCGECVPGAGGNSIGLPWPEFLIPAGTTMTISTWFQSTSYTGTCTAAIILKQGNTVIDNAQYPFPGGCNAGYLYGVFFTVPAPATTGYTTVIGSIQGGTNKSGADTFINVE